MWLGQDLESWSFTLNNFKSSCTERPIFTSSFICFIKKKKTKPRQLSGVSLWPECDSEGRDTNSYCCVRSLHLSSDHTVLVLFACASQTLWPLTLCGPAGLRDSVIPFKSIKTCDGLKDAGLNSRERSKVIESSCEGTHLKVVLILMGFYFWL